MIPTVGGIAAGISGGLGILSIVVSAPISIPTITIIAAVAGVYGLLDTLIISQTGKQIGTHIGDYVTSNLDEGEARRNEVFSELEKLWNWMVL